MHVRLRQLRLARCIYNSAAHLLTACLGCSQLQGLGRRQLRAASPSSVDLEACCVVRDVFWLAAEALQLLPAASCRGQPPAESSLAELSAPSRQLCHLSAACHWLVQCALLRSSR